MSITKFNTSAPAGEGGGSSTGKKGGNTVWIVLGLAVAGFLAYRYIYKPMKEKQEQENA